MGPKGVRWCANAPRALRPHLAAGHRALQQVSAVRETSPGPYIPVLATHPFLYIFRHYQNTIIIIIIIFTITVAIIRYYNIINIIIIATILYYNIRCVYCYYFTANIVLYAILPFYNIIMYDYYQCYYDDKLFMFIIIIIIILPYIIL